MKGVMRPLGMGERFVMIFSPVIRDSEKVFSFSFIVKEEIKGNKRNKNNNKALPPQTQDKRNSKGCILEGRIDLRLPSLVVMISRLQREKD